MVFILIIYALATTVGVLLFHAMPDWSLVLRVLLADVAATLVIFFMSLILDNASLYDPYWSVQPPIILVLVITHLGIAMTFPILILLFAIFVWAIRLTWNWAKGWEGFDHQDWRYTMLREKAPKVYLLTNLFGIQLMPTVLVFLQLISAILVFQMDPALNLGYVLGAIIIVSSAVLQYVADGQMHAFKQREKGKRTCIDEGLWRISRHPNYFGEVMVWWGLYLMYASAVKTIDWLIIAPLLMTGLFVFISIPMMEKKILSSRPEYKHYQAKVSMLIPWFRKEPMETTSIEAS